MTAPAVSLGRAPSLEQAEQLGDGPLAANLDAAVGAARTLLAALGARLEDEALARTPQRLVSALTELLTPRPFEFTTFPNEEGYDELVVARAIPFASLCEHHALPFRGVAHVGYLPSDRIVGLSKLARAVEHYARRFQVQERLTVQIADLLDSQLSPSGVGVVVEAEHLCMSLRGAQTPGAVTFTSAMRGALRDDARTRSEFLALVRQP